MSNANFQVPSTVLVHCPGMEIQLGGKGRRGHLNEAEAEVVVADAAGASLDTPVVVENAASGTAGEEAVGIDIEEVAGTAAVRVVDIAPAGLVPAAAAPLAPDDGRARSTHRLGHAAAQTDPSTIFGVP